MTREEILAMKPGRELDALVATKVMGYKTPYNDSFIQVEDGMMHYFDPSENITAAWEVVEKVGQSAEVKVFNRSGWTCYISSNLDLGFNFRATGETAPEAIAKCCLLAVMEDKP